MNTSDQPSPKDEKGSEQLNRDQTGDKNILEKNKTYLQNLQEEMVREISKKKEPVPETTRASGSPTLKIPMVSPKNAESEIVTVEKAMGLQGIEFPLPPQPVYLDTAKNKEQWDKYTILGTIAEQSHRTALLARDENCHRLVVIKSLHLNVGVEKYHLQRFLEEAQIWAQLEHPAIVPVYEIGMDAEGQMYVAMRYIPGLPIPQFLDQKNWREEAQQRYLQLLLACLQICRAMAYIHERGVYHRNLTPDNILITPDGAPYILGWSVCRVKDRGMAIFDNDANQNIRSTGKLQTIDGRQVGDICYMAPEMIQEKLRYVDERADMYALGAILYFILVGERPFKSQTVAETVQKICQPIRHVPSRGKNFTVPRNIRRLINKAMAFDRTERYQSADEMANALEKIMKPKSWFGIL